MQEKPFPNQLRNTANTANDLRWTRLMPRSLIEIVLVALVVLVISTQLKYLLEVRTIVPHQDEWNLLDKMFQALDAHQLGRWIFQPYNGHFIVPGTLAYLVSLHYLSLDLTPLRLLNFPICLAAFLLTARAVNINVESRFLRFSLYLGACFVIFNLCFWEHFSQGALFTTTLSALFGGVGLYFIAKATQLSWKQRSNLAVGFVFIVVSILSFGIGYSAAAAAILLLALSGLKKLTASRSIPGYKIIVYYLPWALGLLAIASHPFFHLKSTIIQAVFHFVLVAGAVGSSFINQNALMAQNVAFVCGVILIISSLSIGFDFLVKQIPRRQLLPVFSLALILFGLFGCASVAMARSRLPIGELLSSRYTLPPSICLLGTLLYLACSNVFLMKSMWCFAAACYLPVTFKELQVAPARVAAYKAIDLGIRNIETLPDEKLKTILYFRVNTAGVRRVAARMRQDRLNIFHRSLDSDNVQP